MISHKMQEALNAQIQAEFYSSYLYLGMSSYCETRNFKGMAHWLRTQYEEERAHALKLLDHLLERGGTPVLKPLEAPPAEYGSPIQVFEKVLAHEQHVTALIHKLYETALAEKDYAAQIALQWFVNEQVEEEASATEIVEKLKFVGDKGGGVMYLDKELGKRGK